MSTDGRYLSAGTEPVTNLNAQIRELKRLRDMVRKAELSIQRPQRKPRGKTVRLEKNVLLERARRGGPS
jgi:hypothetical protein